MEPDRFAEEQRRGMTIDLGYAWTRIGGGSGAAPTTLAFVDVPGHERFIASMLAGLGPAPAGMFVVAPDQGRRRPAQGQLPPPPAPRLASGPLGGPPRGPPPPRPAPPRAGGRGPPPRPPAG